MSIKDIAGLFGVDAETVTKVNIGHINSTCIIGSPQGRYIIQSLNTDVYKDPQTVAHNLAELTRAFHGAEDVSVPDFIAADGRLLAEAEGGVWRMYRYIPSFEPAEDRNYCIGYSCGAFMRTAEDGAPDIVPTVPDFHSFRSHYRGMTEAYETAEKESPQILTDEVKRMAEVLAGYAGNIADCFGGMQKRPIHGDPKADNFVLGADYRSGTVIDLDNAMYGFAAIDYGDMVRSVTGISGTDALQPVTEGFAAGLRGALSRDETYSLADGIVYVAAELGVRYLEDYLRGVVFFRSKTPEQCLERVRQLLAQLDVFTRDRAETETVIKHCFG